MYGGSYSGANYDPYGDRYDDSPFERMKQQYWTAKQTIISKLGKKEDDLLVASDAEFDSKLSVFNSIKSTSENLLKCIERYQDYIGELARDENALGRLLKSRGKADKTHAGKLMAAVGRAQSYTAQQRLALRIPLVRLYQELDVFSKRAVIDCFTTVEATLKARNEYRGSLLRMKDVSQQLDPDTYKQLEKFRNIQTLVRKNKAKFDKLKLDCLQKIDLLAASRCNLFSQVLTNYQTCLVRFWDKTAGAHNLIADAFKGIHQYEFTILKELSEPSGRSTGDADSDNKADSSKSQIELIALCDKGQSDEKLVRTESLENLFRDSPVHEKGLPIDSMSLFEPRATDTGAIPLSADVEMLLSVMEGPAQQSKTSKAADSGVQGSQQQDINVKDDSAQFIEQLLADVGHDAPENSFSKQWQQTFGLGTGYSPISSAAVTSSPTMGNKLSNQNMMPSQLLDLRQSPWSYASSAPKYTNNASPAAASSLSSLSREAGSKPKDKNKGAKQDPKSAWFDLFADIDPLQNPDALGKTDKDTDRSC